MTQNKKLKEFILKYKYAGRMSGKEFEALFSWIDKHYISREAVEDKLFEFLEDKHNPLDGSLDSELITNDNLDLSKEFVDSLKQKSNE